MKLFRISETVSRSESPAEALVAIAVIPFTQAPDIAADPSRHQSAAFNFFAARPCPQLAQTAGLGWLPCLPVLVSVLTKRHYNLRATVSLTRSLYSPVSHAAPT